MNLFWLGFFSILSVSPANASALQVGEVENIGHLSFITAPAWVDGSGTPIPLGASESFLPSTNIAFCAEALHMDLSHILSAAFELTNPSANQKLAFFDPIHGQFTVRVADSAYDEGILSRLICLQDSTGEAPIGDSVTENNGVLTVVSPRVIYQGYSYPMTYDPEVIDDLCGFYGYKHATSADFSLHAVTTPSYSVDEAVDVDSLIPDLEVEYEPDSVLLPGASTDPALFLTQLVCE